MRSSVSAGEDDPGGMEVSQATLADERTSGSAAPSATPAPLGPRNRPQSTEAAETATVKVRPRGIPTRMAAGILSRNLAEPFE